MAEGARCQAHHWKAVHVFHGVRRMPQSGPPYTHSGAGTNRHSRSALIYFRPGILTNPYMTCATTATSATSMNGKACWPSCLKDKLAAHSTPPSAGPRPAETTRRKAALSLVHFSHCCRQPGQCA